MRTLWSPVGAATGNQRGTKGMPEVQKPVLEHAPTEAQNPQVTGVTLAQNSDIVKSVTCTENVRKWRTYTMDVWIDPVARTATLLSMTEPVEITESVSRPLSLA